jgi:endonuclease/exonuclease/phosphatase family metal-dependent hydrolase
VAVTAAQVARLRRLTAEPDGSNGYDDPTLTEIIERYPLVDVDGYDLNAAAADVWAEKAAVLAGDFDFSADGGQYSRSQAHQQAMQMSRYYRARRSPRTITARMEPRLQTVTE